MKLGVQLNSFDWTGGPERFGRNLADIGMGIETVIGFVPNVDGITPLEIIGDEVIPAVANL